MDEFELEIQKVCKRKCEACKIIHVCFRCVKNMHICTECGKLSHDCDVCGATMNSLSEIKKHQKESKICRKARLLTFTSFDDQLSKAGIKVVHKHRRRSSIGVVS